MFNLACLYSSSIFPVSKVQADSIQLQRTLDPTYRRSRRPRNHCWFPGFLSPEETERLGQVLREAEEEMPSAVAAFRLLLLTGCRMSTAAGICTGAAAQKCTTGSVVACPHSPWEGPARGATRPPRGWRRPARERGVWAHAGKRGVIRTVAGVVTGSA